MNIQQASWNYWTIAHVLLRVSTVSYLLLMQPTVQSPSVAEHTSVKHEKKIWRDKKAKKGKSDDYKSPHVTPIMDGLICVWVFSQAEPKIITLWVTSLMRIHVYLYKNVRWAVPLCPPGECIFHYLYRWDFESAETRISRSWFSGCGWGVGRGVAVNQCGRDSWITERSKDSYNLEKRRKWQHAKTCSCSSNLSQLALNDQNDEHTLTGKSGHFLFAMLILVWKSLLIVLIAQHHKTCSRHHFAWLKEFTQIIQTILVCEDKIAHNTETWNQCSCKSWALWPYKYIYGYKYCI